MDPIFSFALEPKNKEGKKRVSITGRADRANEAIRCLLFGFVDYSGKRMKSFDVLTSKQELEVLMATYGLEIDQSQHTKSGSHIIRFVYFLSLFDI